MVKMNKRVVFRYFNYIMQDNKDEHDRAKDDKEERERQEELARKKAERENMMRSAGKL